MFLRYLLCCLLCLPLANVLAQDYGNTPDVSTYRDKATFKDPYDNVGGKGVNLTSAVDTTLRKPAIKVERDSALSVGFREYSNPYRSWRSTQGYRVQLYNGDREKASVAQYDFMEMRTGQEVYMEYDHPNFKVRVGNFETEDEAKTFARDMQKQFPGAYVVPCQIEIEK